MIYTYGLTVDQRVSDSQCWVVPSGLINQDVQYTLYGAHSDGNSAEAIIYSCAVSPCYNVSHTFNAVYTSGYDPDYSDEIYNQTYHEYSCSGHCIWGVNWYANRWADSGHTLYYHTTPSGNHVSGCSGAGCPTTVAPAGFVLFWVDGLYPADSGSNGGWLNACLYSSYGNYPYCTHNG